MSPAGYAANLRRPVADAIRAYRATHHQVVAQVVEENAIVAQVTWKDEAGVQRTGQVRTPVDRVS
ncbi:hypothetical protein, partial [Nonomuraea sp. NPDC049784]|uniref:hypothetical protein n=1 Tax=Nonomuraea sp. NPDC049784 TaxID=3154361 RepID=UPI0033CF6DA6